MYEGFSTSEIWPFECPRCLMVWEEEYVVRHLTDGHGNVADVWLHAGFQVQPPWSGAHCPGCGDTGVKSFPRGYLARHPELRPARPVPATAPAPALGDPAPSLASPGRRFPLRAPAMLYAAIGLSILLFASIELFEILRATHRVH
ncbi:hypothetical protein AB0B89_22780 [Sphaerisporangium sp. NPDC049002]|uniref:hypothetical protein n=1 Tax=unclassified Sphaerisporangium TaxID=2630420 RepID=UPI0033ED78B9